MVIIVTLSECQLTYQFESLGRAATNTNSLILNYFLPILYINIFFGTCVFSYLFSFVIVFLRRETFSGNDNNNSYHRTSIHHSCLENKSQECHKEKYLYFSVF